MRLIADGLATKKWSGATERGRSELLRFRPTSQSNGSYSELEECWSELEEYPPAPSAEGSAE